MCPATGKCTVLQQQEYSADTLKRVDLVQVIINNKKSENNKRKTDKNTMVKQTKKQYI